MAAADDQTLASVRPLYAARQETLLHEARTQLSGSLEVRPVEAGPYVISWLPEGIDDLDVARSAARHAVTVLPLSAYSVAPLGRGGLLLGYAAVDAQEMPGAVARLATAIRETQATG